jgi:hypothetical protein
MILSTDQANIVQRLILYYGIFHMRGGYTEFEVGEVQSCINAIFSGKDKEQ